jgi:hypothetical protein
MKKIILFLMVVVLFAVVGCSGGMPNDTQVEKAFSDYWKKEHPGLVKYSNFKKTNGSERDPKTYIAYVEYDAASASPQPYPWHYKNTLTLISSEKGWIVSEVEGPQARP